MKRFVFFVFGLFMTSFLYPQKALYKGIGGTEHKIMFAESELENGIYVPERGDPENAAQMAISKDLEIIGNWMIETDKKLKDIAELMKGGTR